MVAVGQFVLPLVIVVLFITLTRTNSQRDIAVIAGLQALNSPVLRPQKVVPIQQISTSRPMASVPLASTKQLAVFCDRSFETGPSRMTAFLRSCGRVASVAVHRPQTDGRQLRKKTTACEALPIAADRVKTPQFTT